MKSELIFEVWKPVPNYEEFYVASNFGRVRSLYKNKILSISQNKNGYCAIILYKRGKLKRFLIHRLVYETFVGSIPDGYEVNHVDEDKTNNFVFVNPDGSVDLKKSNLNLLTHKQNVNWGTSIKRMSFSKMNGSGSKPVYQYTLDGVLVHVWPSSREAERHGFNASCICNCCKGRFKHHKGFLWSYVPL